MFANSRLQPRKRHRDSFPFTNAAGTGQEATERTQHDAQTFVEQVQYSRAHMNHGLAAKLSRPRIWSLFRGAPETLESSLSSVVIGESETPPARDRCHWADVRADVDDSVALSGALCRVLRDWGMENSVMNLLPYNFARLSPNRRLLGTRAPAAQRSRFFELSRAFGSTTEMTSPLSGQCDATKLRIMQ